MIELVGVGSTFAPTTAEIAFTLEGCELVAPGNWHYSGTVSTGGQAPLEVPLIFTISHGDVGLGVVRDARIEGNGDFSVVVMQDASVFDARGCGITPRKTDDRAETAYGPVSINTDPLHRDTPAGTVQSLGIGAVMTDLQDPRLPWAVVYWSGLTLPFDRVLAVPPAEAGLRLEKVEPLLDPDSPCQGVRQRFDGASVSQRRNCRPIERAGMTESRELAGGGTLWVDQAGRVTLIRTIDGYEVVVGARSEADAIAISEALVFYDNLVVAPPPAGSPYFDADLDAVISDTMGAEGYEALAVIETDQGFLVPAKGPNRREGLTDAYAQLRTYHFRLYGDQWTLDGVGGGGWDSCVHVGRFVRDGIQVDYAVGFESDWTFEAVAGDRSVPLPMVDGAAIITPEVYQALELPPGDATVFQVRAIDAAGRIIDCATYLPPHVDDITDTTHELGTDEGGTDLTTPVTDTSTP